MAYMSQQKKQIIATALKPILEKYKVKASLSINHHSTIILKIAKSHLDFIGNYEKVLRADFYRMNKACNKSVSTGEVIFDFKDLSITNLFQTKDHFDGECRDFLNEVFVAMNAGNHDRSDVQTDYFDVGWYSEIKIGTWDKPYIYKPKTISIEEEAHLNKLMDESVKLVDYSEKALAFFGNTKPLKDKLKELGGRFNPFLQHDGERMAGWIFPKSKESELIAILK